jgi:hypothetical protein
MIVSVATPMASTKEFVRLHGIATGATRDRLAPLRLFAEDCAAVAQRRARISMCVEQLQLLAQLAPPQHQQQQREQQQHSSGTKPVSSTAAASTTTAGGCLLYDLSVRGAQKRAYAALLCRTLAQQCLQNQVYHKQLQHTVVAFRSNAVVCTEATILTVCPEHN